MTTSPIRVLVVDDYEPWRHFGASTIQKQPEFQVVGEAADGSEAVQKAQQLQPDLILLDIGLPLLNGIEAARKIREQSPGCKIIFVSENRSSDIVETALATGANGYVVKSDAGSQLQPAISAALRGERFLSAALASEGTSVNDRIMSTLHCHEVAFYEDDVSLVDGYADFIESALQDGNAVIVVVTELHRCILVQRLERDGVDVAAAIQRGTYIPVDAADALARVTINNIPDPIRCANVIRDFITAGAEAVQNKHDRVAVCGETAPILLSKGNAEGAIQLEHLWDEITKGFGARTLCGYLRSGFLGEENSPVFQKICAEHSAIRN
jgi:CheY-like chemotaxis protein